jgi:hypothetical protein
MPCFPDRRVGGVRSQKFDVISNRAFDPFGLDVGVFVIAVFENRALPFDFPGGRRGREQLGHDRPAIFREDGPTTSRSEGLMHLAFRQSVTLSAVNGAVHFPRGLPIFPGRVRRAPIVAALLSETEVSAGFGFIGRSVRNLPGPPGPPLPQTLRHRRCASLRTERGELNDLCGFGVMYVLAHDCTPQTFATDAAKPSSKGLQRQGDR